MSGSWNVVLDQVTRRMVSSATVGAVLLAMLVTTPIAHTSLGAQIRTTTATADPLAEITALFQAREPATTAAGTLRRTHNRTPAQATAIMRTAGYSPVAIAGALRTEYTATLTVIYASLREATVPQTTIRDAFAANSFTLDCVDPQGNPVPCGIFGGTEETPVMGQITWMPNSAGYTDSLLTISGSALPSMWVRIGTVELQQVSASSSQLVVRLPSMQVSGPLKLQRKSDGTTASLIAFSVTPAPLPWKNWRDAAITAAAMEVKAWLLNASINANACVVNGPVAVGTPGVLSSAYTFQNLIGNALVNAGAPTDLASAWNNAFLAAWNGWADAVIIPALPLFPTFAAVAADSAPPTPSHPVPLGSFVSTGSLNMSASSLAQRVTEAIASVSPPSSARTEAVDGFALNLGTRFTKLLLSPVANLLGTGRVPGYQPPSSLIAAVVNGSCSGSNVLSAAASTF